MRIKYQKLVGLLMLLAIVCSLVAITAAPASATAVTAVTITPSPATASDTAGYTLQFTIATAVPVGGTVSITFPTGVTLPATISKSLVALNAITWATGDADPTVSGQQLIITIPSSGAWANGTKTITISQGAGIKNPPIAKTIASLAYQVSVVTSADTTAGIGYLGIIPSYAISPTSGTRSTPVTVTGKGWAPNQSVTISKGLSGSGVVLADGTFSLTAMPLTSDDVWCKDGAGQTENATGDTGSVIWDSPGGVLTIPSFYLSATVAVTPTSGIVGTSVTISGRDFTSGGQITDIAYTAGIYIGGVAWGPTTGNITLTTIDAYGTNDDFSVTLAVPATIGGGAKTVQVLDNSSKAATATFTVNAPAIALNPTSGAPNTLVAVSGTAFKAADTIPIGAITFAGAAWNAAALTVDASGNWNTSLLVPATAAIGNNPVVVTSTAGTTANTLFAVGQRSLTVMFNGATSGPVGVYAVVQAANMTPNGTIPINGLTFAGAPWNTAAAITIDSLGNMSPTTLQVPLFGTGPQTVVASDGTVTATGSFTITQPTITISPATGFKGNTLTVTGAGWVPGNLGLVQIKFNDVIQIVSTPDATGAFTGAFVVPISASLLGNTVGAVDINGNVAANKAFLLGPRTIAINPTSGGVGTKVTVTGVGFDPLGALVQLTIGGATVLPGTPVTTDNAGKFTTSFTVPGLAQTAQTVTAAVNNVANSATTFFTITAAAATVDVQLASISDQLVIVWRYQAGNWTFYDPTDVVGSTLTSLQKNAGYFVKVSAACTLTYLGNTIPLDADWNNIGWPG
jgi:hypothetical protein